MHDPQLSHMTRTLTVCAIAIHRAPGAAASAARRRRCGCFATRCSIGVLRRSCFASMGLRQGLRAQARLSRSTPGFRLAGGSRSGSRISSTDGLARLHSGEGSHGVTGYPSFCLRSWMPPAAMRLSKVEKRPAVGRTLSLGPGHPCNRRNRTSASKGTKVTSLQERDSVCYIAYTHCSQIQPDEKQIGRIKPDASRPLPHARPPHSMVTRGRSGHISACP